MFLLNLTLGQVLMLFGAGALVTVAFYLLDRTRRRQVVSSLRFFVPASGQPQTTRQRRIQQPWSLLLQLLGLLFLLLAIGQLRLGDRGPSPRDHIVILDSSAWMGARLGAGLAMDDAKRKALAYLRSLPPEDRVMLLRADATAAPVTFFETGREQVEAAIHAAQPSPVSLDLDEALEFASQVHKSRSRNPGEIVLISMLRPENEEVRLAADLGSRLRVIAVEGGVENCGLRKITVKSTTADPSLWEAVLNVRNYGATARQGLAVLRFGGAIVGTAPVRMAPGQESQIAMRFRTRAAGELEVTLQPGDALPEDNFARVELPSRHVLAVQVYSAQPEALRPAFTTNPMVEASFLSCAAYRPAAETAIVVFDGCKPTAEPQAPAIWMEPPGSGTAGGTAVRITSWNPGHPLTAGLRSLDLPLEQVAFLRPAPGEEVIAEADGRPVIVARSAAPRHVRLGFHPTRGRTRYELASPLLLANILKWLDAQSFSAPEVMAGSIGAVSVPVPAEIAAAEFRVKDESGVEVPFSLHGDRLNFFAGRPGAYRVVGPLQEQTYSLTLPQVSAVQWAAPASAAKGVPTAARFFASSRDVWVWLALLGALCLMIDWVLFGRKRGILTSQPAARRSVAEFFRSSALLERLPGVGRKAS